MRGDSQRNFFVSIVSKLFLSVTNSLLGMVRIFNKSLSSNFSSSTVIGFALFVVPLIPELKLSK